ncbi:hypothetical protein [Thermococcus sp. 2319x1]|uniref:hypothetical protein n=1 Tax=Thermococcus sp. 2319x1 TaxID=1674923 RepID=UPI001584283A|nr:hypothetical protein [Thermococcus sp. 2319x1]
MWAFRMEVMEVLEKMEIDTDGFDLKANLFVESAKKGFKIGGVLINYYRGKGSVNLDPIQDG